MEQGVKDGAMPAAAQLRKLFARGSTMQASLIICGKNSQEANSSTAATIKKELFTTATKQTMSDERILQKMAKRLSVVSKNSAQLIRDV